MSVYISGKDRSQFDEIVDKLRSAIRDLDEMIDSDKYYNSSYASEIKNIGRSCLMGADMIESFSRGGE